MTTNLGELTVNLRGVLPRCKTCQWYSRDVGDCGNPRLMQETAMTRLERAEGYELASKELFVPPSEDFGCLYHRARK